MRNSGLAVVVSAFLLAACGGGESRPADTGSAVTPAATPPAATSAGAVSMSPITGTTHTINMVGDDKGYRFEPATLTAKLGDGVKFVMVSGPPHNITLDAATVPEEAKAQLIANMPNSTGDMASPMMMNLNEAWTMSLGNVKPGTYGIICTPHLAMGMKMELIVQ